MSAPFLNVDAGEQGDEPDELYALADLVHVACGGHAGDAASMDRVARLCARFGTRVGAHPSYTDREGFGRRALDVTPDVLRTQIADQSAALRTVCERHEVSIVSAKLHGALYHVAAATPAIAAACIGGIVRSLGRVAIVGPPQSALATAADGASLAFWREAFADRAVASDGSLVPRSDPGALVTDPVVAARRATELATRGDVETICIHGDTPGALAIARAVRAALGPKP